MMEFLRSMFLTPEAQVGAYPWAAAFAGHAFVGVLLLALSGALCWALCAAVGRLGVTPKFRPSTYALLGTLVAYAAWEAAQVVFVGGGVGDALTDWIAVACGALIGWGAWRAVLPAIAWGIVVFVAMILAGVRGRNPFN